MWKIYQDKTVANDGYGNCRNAAIASILELRLSEIPDIRTTHDDYHEMWRFALADLGYKIETYPIFEDEEDNEIPRGYAIASVETKRVFPEEHPKAGQNIHHAVVVFGGELVHDPFPLGSEITKINYYEVLVPLSEAEKNLHRLTRSKQILEDRINDR
jgi:hypothetical protein